MVVGCTGFIGRNLVKYLNKYDNSCITVSRNLPKSNSSKHLTLTEFANLSGTEFEKLEIEEIVYALGDPNMSGEKNTESEILQNFLDKLKEFHFNGKFLLISSNAANPDSGLAEDWYRRGLHNAYIHRKQLLETIALSSNFHVTVLRSPAVIGLDMNDSSHVKKILVKRVVGKVLSMRFFRGSIEVITIEDLCKEIVAGLDNKQPKLIIEPYSPTYRWFKIAKFLVDGGALKFEDILILSKFHQRIARLLPVTTRFLLFPHWVTKPQNTQLEILIKHQNILEMLLAIKNQEQDLTKTIIVTGAASGLGAEVTKLLLKDQHKVIGVDIVETIHGSEILDFKENSNFQYFCGDLGSAEFLEEISKIVESEDVSGIFSIAGIGPRGTAKDLNDDQLMRIFGVNFFAQVGLAHSLLRRKNSDSFFVYLGSSSGIEGLPNFAAYSASKAAIQVYFFSLICELSKNDIRVLGAIPSGMKTNFQKSNDVPRSSFDNYLLDDPAKVAQYLVNWSRKKNKKSRVKYFGISARLFLSIRNLPFFIKLRIIRSISKGTR